MVCVDIIVVLVLGYNLFFREVAEHTYYERFIILRDRAHYQSLIATKALSCVGRKSRETCPWAAFTRTILKRSTGLTLNEYSALKHWYELMGRAKRGGAYFLSDSHKLRSGDVVFYAESGLLAHTGIYIGKYTGPRGDNAGKNFAYEDGVVQNSSAEERIMVFSMNEFMKKQGQTFLGGVRIVYPR